MTNDMLRRLGAPERIDRLASYDLFDAGLRRELDGLCAASAERLRWPVALVTIVLDYAQLIAGRHGLATPSAASRAVHVDYSFCAHAVVSGAPYVVPDAARHPLHATSPAVTAQGIGAYAGVPLVGRDGTVLGAHCVVDLAPREVPDGVVEALQATAHEASRVLEAHRPVRPLDGGARN